MTTEFDAKKYERNLMDKVKMILERNRDEYHNVVREVAELRAKVEKLERTASLFSMVVRLERLERMAVGDE